MLPADDYFEEICDKLEEKGFNEDEVEDMKQLIENYGDASINEDYEENRERPDFTRIDMAHYPRIEQYTYFKQSGLSFSTTVNIDITSLKAALKDKGVKEYPAQMWLLTTAANTIPEFRMFLDWDGNLAYWDSVSPFYATFCKDTKSVSLIETEYNHFFSLFYNDYKNDVEKFCNGHFVPQGKIEPNNINISSVPWIDFTDMSFSAMPTGDFRPQLVIGRYLEQDGKVLMPLSITVSHAVCDGYHVGQFIKKVRELVENYKDWLK
jgi:chloramphenicol O-acetyltransferase type A